MKKTAVDFTAEQLEKLIPSGNQIIIAIIIEKAKQMEKEQIKEAFIVGNSAKGLRFGSEKYYNQTYLEI